MPLYSMAVGTGVITEIGGSLKEISSLTYDTTNSILYGLSKIGGGQIYTINTTTGVATKVGTGGKYSDVTRLIWATDSEVMVTYSPLRGGTFYTYTEGPDVMELVVNRGATGFGNFRMATYSVPGIAFLMNRNGYFAAVDIATGNVLSTVTDNPRNLIDIARDDTGGYTYLFSRKLLLRVNDDESPPVTVATAGLGTFRAMAFTTNALGVMYFVG